MSATERHWLHDHMIVRVIKLTWANIHCQVSLSEKCRTEQNLKLALVELNVTHIKQQHRHIDQNQEDRMLQPYSPVPDLPVETVRICIAEVC